MIARIDPIPCSLESILHQSPEGRKGGVDWLISGYHYREAAAVTQSNWLGSFGGGDVNGQLQPSLMGAVLEGSVLSFLKQSNLYDPVLWTMHDELFGSLLTFGLGLIVWRSRPRAGVVALLF